MGSSGEFGNPLRKFKLVFLGEQSGYPLTKKELLYEVKRILDIDGRKTSFPDNLPGKGWYKAFRNRNPEIAERTPAALGYHRAIISLDMIKGWYDGLFQFLVKEVPGHATLVKDPRRIFNADESGFPICVKSSSVLAPSGSKHVYQVLPGDKSQITVMACFNVFGDYMSPLIVYPGQRFRETVLSGFEDAIYGNSKNGWMDSELFIAFLEHFDRFLIDKSIQRPVILFVDGHSTHMSLPAAQFCSDHQIILYCLLPNATHVLQACDIGLFSPMKAKWKEMVKKWQMIHLGEVFTKKHFPEVFKSTWESVATLSNSISAFKRSGLFPLSPDGVDKSKLSPSEGISVADVPSASQTVTTDVSSPDSGSAVSSGTSCNAPVPDVPLPSTATQSLTVTNSVAVCTKSSSDSNVGPMQVESPPGPTACSSLQSVRSSASVIRLKGDQSYVSPAFNFLRVPEIKQKRSTSTLRQKLPKALSGSEALSMLKEREEKKKKEEQAKLERKAERERKKREREEESARKKREREIKKKIKLIEKKKNTKDNSDSEESIPYMDSSDDDGVQCPVCLSGEGREWEWVGCENCPLWWHIDCTGREDFLGKRAEDLEGIRFVCEMCSNN